RAGLLEDHGQRAVRVGKGLVLLDGLELALDERRALEQVRVLVGAQVLELQVVADRHGYAHSARKALTSGTRMAAMASASAVVMINGGTRRITLSAVTDSSSPASAARCVIAPHGLSSSMPSIRP